MESTRTAKVLLIAPQTKVYKSGAAYLEKSSFKRAQPWLGLGYLAAVLIERGHEAVYLDATLEGFDQDFDFNGDTFCYGLDYDQIRARVAELQPDVVGLTCLFSSQSDLIKGIARAVKSVNPKILTVAGGIHTSYLPEHVMREPAIDVVIRGEGEFVFEELVRRYVNGNPYTDLAGVVYRRDDGSLGMDPRSARIDVISDLPMPARHLMPIERYWDIGLFSNPYSRSKRVITLMTSRGCPEHCTFCSSAQFFGHTYRAFPAERVIEEIRYCKEVLGAEEFQFLDDTFTLNRQRVMDICAGIKDLGISACTPNGIRIDYHPDWDKKRELFRAMKEAGFYQVTFAIESGNQGVLDNIIRKRLNLKVVGPTIKIAQEEGLFVHTFFMLGLPTETRAQMLDTLRFAESIEADSYSFSVTIPLPGTAIWHMCEEQKLFVDGFVPSDLMYRRSSIKLADMTSEEVEQMAQEASHRLNQMALQRRPQNQQRYAQFAQRHQEGAATDLGERMNRFLTPLPGD